jgi:hypothetical protein
MADGSSAETISVQWRHEGFGFGRYEVRHFTGKSCERCEGSGTEVHLLQPMRCGACSGTGRELIAGCRCETCVSLRETNR